MFRRLFPHARAELLGSLWDRKPACEITVGRTLGLGLVFNGWKVEVAWVVVRRTSGYRVYLDGLWNTSVYSYMLLRYHAACEGGWA